MKLGKFIFGLGLGAVAGLLLAPKKGSEMREDLKNKSMEAYNQYKDMSKEDLEALVGETLENVKKSVDEFDMDEFKASTKEKVVELQEKLEVLSERIKASEEYGQIKEGVIDLTQKVNEKIVEVKTKIDEVGLEDGDYENLENEINDVEDKLDEMVEEIKE